VTSSIVGDVPTPEPPQENLFRQIAGRAGFIGSALAVFTCGWLAMRADDWKRIVLFSALALVAGALASAFSRRSR
jgi:hypothetical protein